MYQRRRLVPLGAHSLVQGAPLAQMAVADRHRHAVERRVVAARDFLPRAENPGAAVDVVDEADEVEAALAGEIAHHLSELARAVDQDLLHFVATNCRYLKQSAVSGRMRRR